MSFLQGIEEPGQLFMFGTILFFAGLIFRKLRKLTSDLRATDPTSQRVESRQS